MSVTAATLAVRDHSGDSATHLEVRFIVGAVEQVHYSCQPSLLLNSFITLLTSSSCATRIGRLLLSFLYENFQNLKNCIETALRRDLRAVPDERLCNLASKRPPCWICL